MDPEHFDNFKFPAKSQRTVKVVVFEEPGCKSGSGIHHQRKRSKSNKTKYNFKDGKSDFLIAAREVKQFGMTGFSKVDRKKNKQLYVESLGAWKQKNEKVPYPLLMERRKKRKEKDLKQKELERAMGIFTKKKKEKNVNTRGKYNLGRWVDKSIIGKQRSRNNVFVDKKEIAKVERRK